jgi:hypothetical protein
MTLLLILWVLCSGVAALIAQSKNRSVGGFAVAGLILGVIGVLWAAFARSGEDIAAARQSQRRGRAPLPPKLRDAQPLTWHDGE